MKLGIAVAALAAGKRLPVGPGAVKEIMTQQLRNNPQFKEIGEQLRDDMRGVGRAASGAILERQMESLADRLHGRTEAVRDRIADTAPGRSDESDEANEADEAKEADEADEADESGESEESDGARAPARKAAGRTAGAAGRTAGRKASKAPGKQASRARRTTTGRTAAGKTGGRPKGGGARG